MKSVLKKDYLAERRKKRIRTKLKNVNRQQMERIYLHVSNKNLYAQLINDMNSKTLLSVSTLAIMKDSKTKSRTNKECAKKLAEVFSGKIKEAGIDSSKGFIFDRGDRKYHGKVQVFADTLREKGIKV